MVSTSTVWTRFGLFVCALINCWIGSKFREGKDLDGLDQILSLCVCFDFIMVRL